MFRARRARKQGASSYMYQVTRRYLIQATGSHQHPVVIALDRRERHCHRCELHALWLCSLSHVKLVLGPVPS